MSDTFRKVYTPLSDQQKESVDKIKNEAEILMAEFDKAAPAGERSERSRCMAIARTNLETTIMWAIKGVTTAEEKNDS